MKKLVFFIFRLSIVSVLFSLFFLLYSRYVPFVRAFQIVLVPILLSIFFLTFFRRKYGILLFVFLIPVTNSIPHFFHFKSAPIGPILFFVLFLSLLTRWAIFRERPFRLPSIPFFLSFLFISLISFTLSFLRYSNFFPFADSSIHEWVVNSANLRAGGAIFSVITESLVLISGLLFLSILMKEEENFLFKSLYFFVTGLSISALFSIFQAFYGFIGVEELWIGLKRVNGLAEDPNSLGISLSLMIPFILFLVIERKKFFFIPIIFLFLFSIFLSGSRSGFANLVLSTIIFLYLFLRSGKKRIILTISVFLILALSIFSSFILKSERFNLSDRLIESWNQLKESKFQAFTMGRTLLWKAGLLITKDYPISGVGLGAYISELPNFYKEYNLTYIAPLSEYKKGYPYPFTDTSGNLYLQLLSETGILGLLSFSIFWFYILVSSIRKNFNPFASSTILSFSFISLLGFHILKSDVSFGVYLLLRFLILDGRKIKNIKYLELFTILVFMIFFLISSTTSLSIKNRTEKFGWEQDYGFHRWENYEKGSFRWTKKGAGFEMFLSSQFFTIDFNASHPDIEKKPVKVRILISENPFKKKEKLDEFTLMEKGWKKKGYSVKELEGKKAFISIEVSRTWNPMRELGVPDPRNIGVGIGKIDFGISEEIGFYNWERDQNGILFRWTLKRAFLPMDVKKERIAFPVRISHPDAQKKPVELLITVNGVVAQREVFNDHEWYEVELDLKEYMGKGVVIGFSVSKTWCPKDHGINDGRELGVAVGRLE